MKKMTFSVGTILAGWSFLMLAANPAAFAQKPDIHIGMVEDGPWQRDQQVRSAVESEIRSVLSSTHDVFFPEEKRLQGGWELSTIRSAIDRLLADPEVDLIITLGALGSYDAATRQYLAKPVVAARVVAPDLLHIPSKVEDGEVVSGTPNLSYVTLVDTPLKEAVTLFHDLVGFENVTFLVMEPARQIYPDLPNAVRTVLRDLNLERIDMLFIKNDVGPVLKRIPEETEAVVLTAQPQLGSAEYQELFEFLVEAKILSFTLGSREDLAAGALFGLDTKNALKLAAGRVASNVRKIVDGEDAAKLPVRLGVEESLLYNNAVAAAIGYDVQKVMGKKAAAEQQASGAGPSLSPVTDEVEEPQLRRGGPELSAEELQQRQSELIKKIQRAISRMSSYSAFDSVSFRVEGVDKVTLLGYAMDPSVKNQAERLVKGIEEVAELHNLIEVLPVSGMDDDIRARAYAAIYGHPNMRRYVPGAGFSSMDVRNFLRDINRYGVRSAQITKGPHAIHILVKNGHVALVGVVRSGMDKQIAEVQAKSVPGVFSVENHLQVGS